LGDIQSWINDVSSPHRALLLTGEAGTGKSAIAHAIAQLYDGMGRLGSAYCFNRNEIELTRIDTVIPTIARHLASCEPQMKTVLSRMVEKKPTIAQTQGIRQQFDELLLALFSQVDIPGPVVIVIDALDESDPTSRSNLLAVLKEKLVELPTTIRIVITSRLESDVKNAFGAHDLVVWKQMGDIDRDCAARDIDQYIRSQLRVLQDSFTNYEAICKDLVTAAGTSFQWASTACRVITGSQQTMYSAQEQAEAILSASKDSESSRPLDQLYMQILSQVFKDGPVPQRYGLVMSHVLAACGPLSMQSLDDLLVGSGALQAGDVDKVIGQLGALLSGTDRSHRVVQPLHISFRDFIIDKDRSSNFAVQPGPTQDVSFLRGSLEVLNKQLAFNMCRMETSYKLNSDYDNLQSSLTEKTSAALVYAVLYWGKHLGKIDATLLDNVTLVDSVKNLLERKGLFWIEALSLLGSIKTSSSALATVKRHLQSIPSTQVCIGMCLGGYS
jgi:DNA polymerase III delta prime subunit